MKEFTPYQLREHLRWVYSRQDYYKKSMKYKFTVAEEGKPAEEKESMSFKKLFKSLININPKWTGSLTYDNKKGRQVIHRIKNGRRIYG